VDDFYEHLIRFTDTMVEAGFLRKSYRDVLLVDTDLAALLDRFAAYEPPTDKWSRQG
jgi:predicted Rossmann-fold nucleotide-binding protein